MTKQQPCPRCRWATFSSNGTSVAIIAGQHVVDLLAARRALEALPVAILRRSLIAHNRRALLRGGPCRCLLLNRRRRLRPHVGRQADESNDQQEPHNFPPSAAPDARQSTAPAAACTGSR